MNDFSGLSRAELLQRLKALTAADGSAAHESATRLQAILATAVEGIITIDEHGLIESLNPAAERIFGYRPAEIIEQNVSCLMPAPYRDHHDTYLANYLGGAPAKIIGIGREVVGQRKDGAVFPMDLSVSEVRIGGRRLFTGFVRDISERRRLEKETLEISDREQRRIGHDLHDGLCQQLAGIELQCQVLAQQLEAKSPPDAGRVDEIARHVRDAIGQTRLLARGLSPVVLDAEGLTSALHELADQARTMFHVDCHFHCDAPVPIADHAVATHLFRIAQEAVSNAIKHGRTKRIDLRLRQALGRTIVAVKDYGRGLPADTGRKGGMGLRIMRYRAGLIGGSLAVQRDANGGTSVVCSVQTAGEATGDVVI